VGPLGFSCSVRAADCESASYQYTRLPPPSNSGSWRRMRQVEVAGFAVLKNRNHFYLDFCISKGPTPDVPPNAIRKKFNPCSLFINHGHGQCGIFPKATPINTPFSRSLIPLLSQSIHYRISRNAVARKRLSNIVRESSILTNYNM
jgi:hypothetical protein